MEWASSKVILVTFPCHWLHTAMPQRHLLKPRLHRAATIVPPLPPEKWSGRSVVVPTQKVLFLCDCCSTTLVPSLNQKNCYSIVAQQVTEWRQNHYHSGSRVTVVDEWRHIGRHSDRSMDAIGRPNDSGRKEAETSLKLIHNVYNSTYFLQGDQWPTPVHPFWDWGDICAFLLPPTLSDLCTTNLLGDLCTTVLNILKTSQRSWHPWQGLNLLRATLEQPR